MSPDELRETLKILRENGVVQARLPDGTSVTFGVLFPLQTDRVADPPVDHELAQLDENERAEATNLRELLHSSGGDYLGILDMRKKAAARG